MSSDINFVEFVVNQIDSGKQVAFKKMFGEYALYLNGKVVALICDNQLFVKPTENGREFIGAENVCEDFPYPGAKPYFLIDDKIDDKVWLTELLEITENELPEPKPKVKKKR